MLCPGPTHSSIGVSQNKDGSYTGFIKVHLKLVRPVSVPATKRVPSVQAGRPGPRTQGVKRRTSFYLPKGTVKHLHIFSHTRASEVIDALLRKFTVVDNPRKFALFERSEKDEQGSALGQPCAHTGGHVPTVAISPGQWRTHGDNIPLKWCPPWQPCFCSASISWVVVSPWWRLLWLALVTPVAAASLWQWCFPW